MELKLDKDDKKYFFIALAIGFVLTLNRLTSLETGSDFYFYVLHLALNTGIALLFIKIILYFTRKSKKKKSR